MVSWIVQLPSSLSTARHFTGLLLNSNVIESSMDEAVCPQWSKIWKSTAPDSTAPSKTLARSDKLPIARAVFGTPDWILMLIGLSEDNLVWSSRLTSPISSDIWSRSMFCFESGSARTPRKMIVLPPDASILSTVIKHVSHLQQRSAVNSCRYLPSTSESVITLWCLSVTHKYRSFFTPSCSVGVTVSSLIRTNVGAPGNTLIVVL